MASSAYIGSDIRPRIDVDWSGPDGTIHLNKPFLIDTGATDSAIDTNNAITLRIVGAAAVSTAGGTVNSFIVRGGTMEFEVYDPSAGQNVMVTHSQDLRVLGIDIMGVDVLQAVNVRLVYDPTTQPMGVQLSR